MKAALALCLLSAALAAEAPFHKGDRNEAAAAIAITSGKLRETADRSRDSVARLEEMLGPSHSRSAMARRNLGLSLWHLGRLEEAETELLMARAVAQASEGPASATSLRVLLDLAGLCRDMGRPAEAAAHYERVLELAVDPMLKMEALLAAAAPLAESGRASTARKLLSSALPGAAPKAAWELSLALAGLELHEGRKTQAQAGFEAALKRGEALHGANHPFLAPAWEGLGDSSQSGAEGWWTKALEGRRRMAGLLSYASLPQHEAMAVLLLKLKRNEEAKKLLSEMLAFRQQEQDASHPAIRALQSQLSKLK